MSEGRPQQLGEEPSPEVTKDAPTLGIPSPASEPSPTQPGLPEKEVNPAFVQGKLLAGRYTLQEELGRGGMGVVWATHDTKLDRRVALKLLKTTDSQHRELPSRLLREAQAMARISHPHVVAVYDAGTLEDGSIFIAMELVEGRTLRRWCQESPTWHQVLEAFVDAGKGLAAAHAARLVHRDFKPDNVLVGKDGRVRVTDFGVARAESFATPTATPTPTPSPLALTSQELWHSQLTLPGAVVGTPKYLAPELLAGHPADARSDLFSFCVALYEALYRQYPFPGKSLRERFQAMKQGRCQPPPADTAVPAWVARAVLQGLAADPLERPSSMEELLPLLSRRASRSTALSSMARKLLALAAGEPELAPPGEEVSPSRLEGQGSSGERALPFQLPQRLYGRSAEVATLQASFERVVAGARQAVFVSGYSGTGKSALVSELEGPTTSSRGLFASGKFDQLQRDVPYSALIQAFQALTRKLLSEPPEQLLALRERLVLALSPGAQALIDVVPELAQLLGTPSAAAPTRPGESAAQFNPLVCQLVSALAGPEHPLVLFLDDLQWADPASLQLLQLLLTDPSLTHLLVIGSYRDDEVGEAHPVSTLLAELRTQGVHLDVIPLSPLALEQVGELLADTFRTSLEEVRPLAELVRLRTGGNPFFISQLLTTLHRKHLVHVHPREGRWVWDLERIRGEDLGADVGALLQARFGTLREPTQQVLRRAACIGNRFDVRTLATVAERPLAEVAASLHEALRAGLLLPSGEAPLSSEPPPGGPTGEGAEGEELVCAFVHDKVQQAAYDSIPAAERPAVHRRIGRLLLELSQGEPLDEQLFDILGHFNASLELVEGEAERYELADMNLRAGRRAKGSTAYGTAMRLLATGVSLLPAQAWERRHGLAFSLHLELAEASFLNEDYAQMEGLVGLLRQRARGELEQVRVLELRVDAGAKQLRFDHCIDLALEALSLLGESVPANPGKGHVLLELLRTKLLLRGRSMDSLGALPECQDEVKRAAMRMLQQFMAVSYFSRPNLFPIIGMRILQLSIRHGSTGRSATGCAIYGILLCAALQDYDGGHAFGQLALKLIERFRARDQATYVTVLSCSFIRHWKEPVAWLVTDLLRATQLGLEHGRRELASYAYSHLATCLVIMGEELDVLRAWLGHVCDRVSALKTEHQYRLMLLVRHYLDALQLPTPDRVPPQGDEDDEQLVERWMKAKDSNSLSLAYGYRATARFFTGNLQGSHALWEKYDRHAKVLMGMTLQPFFTFYQAMTLLAVAPGQRGRARQVSLRKVSAIRRRFVKWAQHAPANWAQKLHLVEAELGRVLGRPVEQVDYHYEQALVLARESGYLQDEALAHELLALYLLGRGRRTMAQGHLVEACRLFEAWGATAYVALLQQRYAELLAPGAWMPPDRLALRSWA